MLVKNWKSTYKSFAVWFPVIAVTAIQLAESSMQAHLVPDNWIPYIILITGLVGRVIKQKSLEETV